MKNSKIQNCKGQAIVETAFVLMIIVLFTFAITEFGRAMYIKNMLNNAARAGARQAVVTGSLGSASDPLSFTYTAGSFPLSDTTTSKNIVGSKISESLMYVDKTKVSATVSAYNNAGTSVTTAQAGNTVTVNVSTPYVPFIALFKNIIRNTLVGEASMRYE